MLTLVVGIAALSVWGYIAVSTIKDIHKKKPPAIPETDDERDWRLLNEDIDRTHRLFGPRVELSSATTDAGREIRITCPKCGQKNRLTKGFRGATCGKCHKGLTAAAQQEARMN